MTQLVFGGCYKTWFSSESSKRVDECKGSTDRYVDAKCDAIRYQAKFCEAQYSVRRNKKKFVIAQGRGAKASIDNN